MSSESLKRERFHLLLISVLRNTATVSIYYEDTLNNCTNIAESIILKMSIALECDPEVSEFELHHAITFTFGLITLEKA